MLQVAITLELTAPRPWRSQGTTSGDCQWCPRLEDPPPTQEQGESETCSAFPDKKVWWDYPLRPSVLPPNSNLDTFGF